MRARLILGVLCLTLLSFSSSDPMEQAHCEDTEIERVKSPNGKLVAVIYNRDCSRGAHAFTYADVEDPSEQILWPRDRHPTVCYLVTLTDGVHPLEVRWKDDGHMEVSSTDQLDNQYSVSYPERQCASIKVAFHFKFAPPPLKEAPDKDTVEAISAAISQTEACFNRPPNSERADRLRSLMKENQHGDALEWLCTYLKMEHCPISQNVLTLIQQSAVKMRSTKMSCYRLEEQAAK